MLGVRGDIRKKVTAGTEFKDNVSDARDLSLQR
jgi:hypothetical protein